MMKEELHKTLAALHAEVNRLEGEGNDDVKIRVSQLIQEVEQQLENPDNTDSKGSILEKIPKLIEQFEVEHPAITGTLNRIMMMLSDMGI